MYERKKNGKVFTSKSVGTGPSSCEKRIYQAAVSRRLINTCVQENQLDAQIITKYRIFSNLICNVLQFQKAKKSDAD